MQAAVDAKDAELAEAEKVQQELKEKVLHTLADMENLRSRTKKQMEDARQFAVQGFAKDVLEAVDNLDRALGSVPSELLEETSEKLDAEVLAKNLRSLHNGVGMSQKVGYHSQTTLFV
jgi:molecular chaperone GrpE